MSVEQPGPVIDRFQKTKEKSVEETRLESAIHEAKAQLLEYMTVGERHFCEKWYAKQLRNKYPHSYQRYLEYHYFLGSSPRRPDGSLAFQCDLLKFPEEDSTVAFLDSILGDGTAEKTKRRELLSHYQTVEDEFERRKRELMKNSE